jgi:SAM-dependent methyltransferase
MKTSLSPDNPYGVHAKGFLWEILKQRPRGLHLDYGAHDGAMLKVLAQTGVIERGIGLDLNADVVRAHQTQMPPNVELRTIEKRAKLPFGDATFDSISMIGVLEHIHDQEAILREFHRVMKKDGVLVINVPGQHAFSFLDMGNFKFRFPKLHRFYYVRRHSNELYRQRYVECRNGLIGDIEVEKSWHQHFSHDELRQLLEKCSFHVRQQDGYGFFNRPIINTMYFVPGFLKKPFEKLESWDKRHFHETEIFVAAEKSGVA